MKNKKITIDDGWIKWIKDYLKTEYHPHKDGVMDYPKTWFPLSGFDDWFKVECENSIKELKEQLLKGNNPSPYLSKQNLFDVLIKRTMEIKMVERITEELKERRRNEEKHK